MAFFQYLLVIFVGRVMPCVMCVRKRRDCEPRATIFFMFASAGLGYSARTELA